MTPGPFIVRERVRWRDVDPMGIIRYDAYTRFYELAEGELFRAVGVPHGAFRSLGIAIPRRVMHMEFTSAPVLDEELEVRTYVSEVGTTSLRLAFDIYGTEGALRSTGYLVLVCVDSRVPGITKRPWPPEFLELLAPYTLLAGTPRA